MYSTTIPVIDFSRFLHGSAEDRKQTAIEIDHALKIVGFFHLRNHGIPQSKVESCFDWSRRFFDLPEHEKVKLIPEVRSSTAGYIGIGKEKIRGQTCMKENFGFGNPDDDSRGSWPPPGQLPGFREFAGDFYQDCSLLISELLECLSLALDLDKVESLGQYHGGSLFVTDFIHYPAIPIRYLRSGDVGRAPAHSDTGTLTLLFQHDVGGLQVADMGSTDKTSSAAVEKTAKFLDVEPNPETVLVNIGYLLMRWTNGRWKNTVHRVSEPPITRACDSDDSGLIPERYSIAFFCQPDAETMVEPLHSCCSGELPKRWGPINAGEYLFRKRAASHS